MAMFSKDLKWYLACFIAITLSQQDVDCFFVKHEVSGLCFFASNNSYQSKPSSFGQLFYLELSEECFEPAAQFRFRSNAAIFSIEKKGCLAGYKKSHDHIALFYVYVGLPTLDTSACATQYRRDITQTSGGSLQMNWPLQFRPFRSEKRCAVPKSNTISPSTEAKAGITIGITTSCDVDKNKRFSFGSLTCHSKTTKDVNCHKDQYMVVKTASYRGLPATQTCGLSDNYTCEIDATCLVKKLCDGKNECNITVDDTLFTGNPCPGLSKYLYFEYQCVDTKNIFTELCALTGPPLNIKAAAISYSSISVTWDPPVRYKHNGNVVNYTVCISSAENGTCTKVYTTTKETLVIDELEESTKYYVSVRASTIESVGDYSASLGVSTNAITGSFLRVLTNFSSSNVQGQLGERVFLHCAGEGKPQMPEMSFSWEKNGRKLPSFGELQKPYRSSLLIVNLKNIGDFGRYICHIRDRFGNKSHTIWINKGIGEKMLLTKTNDEPSENLNLYLTGVIILSIITVILLSLTIFLAYRVYVLKRTTASEKGTKKPTQNERISATPEDPEVTDNNVNGNTDYEMVETGKNEEGPMYSSLDKSKMKNDEDYYTHLVKVKVENEDYVNQHA